MSGQVSQVRRWIGLPVVAVVLVVATITVQLTHGGGTYEPLRPADACVERSVTSRATGIDGLTERLVLIGLDEAACTLRTSREALTLQLARQSGDPTTKQVDALREGLLSAVARMKADGSLPKASALVDEVLDSADLNGLLERIIRALPDSVIDRALSTDDVLVRTIDDLDVRALLDDLDDPSALDGRVEKAVTQAVKDSLEARLRDLV
ncbi:hypothetical protein [Aeromicrobium endophyticum]|uniref:Uncharacterized protein n=1 Tax=Aeromicrobium endophyticum TaxID=2292704 RepID=A0A371P8D4_9ACTN|nr:hypothetical protein [Aeromicrobium endophyticum]REK72197.1 hypothetical protein DX116_00680 [Aeromicrobium endophyticum]